MSQNYPDNLDNSLENRLNELHSQTDRAEFNVFDMTGDIDVLKPDPEQKLPEALRHLDEIVGRTWRSHDKIANSNQRSHKWIARFAIGAGVLAVIMVLVQFGLGATSESYKEIAAQFEIGAGVVALLAVVSGLTLHFDTEWLVARHKAERLRILKFRALGRRELWCGTEIEWQTWVDDEIKKIESILSLEDIKTWMEKVDVSPAVDEPTACAIDPSEVQALTSLYYWKRVQHQIFYFQNKAASISGNKSSEDRSHVGHKHALGIWLFGASILMITAHVILEQYNHHRTEGPLHLAGVWCLVLAGLIPVVSFGIRAWKGAFEPARSAALCDAKARQLANDATGIRPGPVQLRDAMRHIAQTEHFFENEHCEWLRLMMETDWLP